jgi:hypothetical protein
LKLVHSIIPQATKEADVMQQADAIGIQRAVAWPLWESAIVAVLAIAVTAGYIGATGQVWEDFLITFRYSQNLIEGKGLVYNEGERVHGFTSPLGVLLPAFFYALLRDGSYEKSLLCFRILSILAYAGGGLITVRALHRAYPQSRGTRMAFMLFYLLEAKSVAFSTNGMETALMLLFMGCGLALLMEPERWWARGFCWAGLLWTRPDGCVFVAALAATDLAFAGTLRRRLLYSLLRSALVASLLYAPWIAWAWSYYSSPIPNTLLAKARPPGMAWTKVLHRMYVAFPDRAAEVFTPVYYPVTWNEPEWINYAAHVLGIFCATYWLVPGGSRLGRSASFCFALLGVYLSFVEMAFPWYFPPMALCGLIAMTDAIGRLYGATHHPALGRGLAVFLTVAVAGGMGCLLGMTAWQMRVQQREVEAGNRERVGLWLRERVRSDENVFVEALGYIGYFSGARMVDWPGLISPQVIQLRRTQQLDYSSVVDALAPDWVVARPNQIPQGAYFRQNYVPVQWFDVRPQLTRFSRVPGMPYLLADAAFCVFRKNSGIPK